jgi:hypothetical protein
VSGPSRVMGPLEEKERGKEREKEEKNLGGIDMAK